MRILLVDDDELNQVLVGTILARAADPALRDAKVSVAGTVAQAALATGSFDVVLPDMRLPDGGGMHLAAELSRSGGTAPVVIAVTGAAAENREAALDADCAAVLRRPGAPRPARPGAPRPARPGAPRPARPGAPRPARPAHVDLRGPAHLDPPGPAHLDPPGPRTLTCAE